MIIEARICHFCIIQPPFLQAVALFLLNGFINQILHKRITVSVPLADVLIRFHKNMKIQAVQ